MVELGNALKIEEKDYQTYKMNTIATEQLQDRLADYYTPLILLPQRLHWVIIKNLKVAVLLVISTIRSPPLTNGLK